MKPEIQVMENRTFQKTVRNYFVIILNNALLNKEKLSKSKATSNLDRMMLPEITDATSDIP